MVENMFVALRVIVAHQTIGLRSHFVRSISEKTLARSDRFVAKSYPLLYFFTCSRQKNRYRPSAFRPTGARCVPFFSHPFDSICGRWVRSAEQISHEPI